MKIAQLSSSGQYYIQASDKEIFGEQMLPLFEEISIPHLERGTIMVFKDNHTKKLFAVQLYRQIDPRFYKEAWRIPYFTGSVVDLDRRCATTNSILPIFRYCRLPTLIELITYDETPTI